VDGELALGVFAGQRAERLVRLRELVGHHVTACVRNPARLDLADPDLTVIGGELTDQEAIQSALRGADAVISALRPSLDRKATGTPLDEGTRTIVDTMRAEGVERYIGMATPSLRDPLDSTCMARA
jgi:putative NADH-flavin reductase